MANGQYLIGPKRSTTTDNFTVNIIGANPKTTNTGNNPIASALLGGLASIFTAAVITKASDTPRSSSTGGSTPAQQTPAQSQAQVLRTQIEAAEGTLEGYEAQYTNLTEEKTRLTEATDETKISAKEQQLEGLKNELFEADGSYKENVKKVNDCEGAIVAANNNLTAAQATVTSIDAEISDLEGKQRNCEALLNDPKNKDAASERINRLVQQIAQKRTEKVSAEAKVEEEKTALQQAQEEKTRLRNELGSQYTEIQTKQTQYDNLKNEVTTLKGQLETNKARLTDVNKQLPELARNIGTLKGNITSMKDQLLDIEGKEALDKQNAAGKYAEADKNDGNWWKRNMPSWLGGSSKSERDSMKKAHKDKEAAGAELENLGLDSDDYSLSSQAKQKATALYDSLNSEQKKDWSNKDRKKAIKFFKENPNASIADAKQYLSIK